MLRILIVAAAGLVCGACASMPHKAMIPVNAVAAGATRVPILVTTTRQPSLDDPGEMFSGERATAISYASASVSIPPDNTRTIGRVQWPTSVPGDPKREFVTSAAKYIDKNAFKAEITRATRGGQRKILVFVHGFNNRFDESVFRFAQIVHDSKSQAVPVLFTWPSRGEIALRAYTYDRESANYSRDALEQLLTSLTREPSISKINIIAHSMGNWITLEALRGMSIRQAHAPDRGDFAKMKNVLLVAPDVDVDVFRSQIARMGAYRPHIALFVSRDDKVLDLSKVIWGGVSRLGDVDPNEELYRTEFEQKKIEVFDLTKLKAAGDNAHSRAFDDITAVMAMIEQRKSDQRRSRNRHTVHQAGTSEDIQ